MCTKKREKKSGQEGGGLGKPLFSSGQYSSPPPPFLLLCHLSLSTEKTTEKGANIFPYRVETLLKTGRKYNSANLVLV